MKQVFIIIFLLNIVVINTYGVNKAIVEKKRNKQAIFNNYRKGEKAFQNHEYDKAFVYFNKVLKQGNKNAYYYLSNMYYLGLGVQIDHKKALELAKEGFIKESIPSSYQYAKYLIKGTGVIPDKDLAQQVFEKYNYLAWFENQYKKHKTPFHAYAIAYMYDHGYGEVKKDSNLALKWYQQAADLGDPVALSNLGTLYEFGIGVEQDYTIAAEYYKKAADLNYPNGHHNLAVRYEMGEGVGGKDYKKAIHLYEMAAEHGSLYAYNGLGDIYNNGPDSLYDYEKVIYWYKKAAEKGLGIAQYNLALMYYRDFGTKEEDDKAIYWFKKAVEKEYLDAYYALAYMYNNGKVDDASGAKAVELFTRGAEKGNIACQFALAEMYDYGRNGFRDEKKAIHWYLQAAKQGYVKAQYKLALKYDSGIEDEGGKEKALFWFKKAAKQDHQQSKEILKNMGETW